MRLKVLLPFRVFADETGVSRIVAETHDGSFGLLPHRRDCVAALMPGILSYQNNVDDEVFIAIDEGLLTKMGDEVWVAVRRATKGTDLAQLREAVQNDYLTLDAIQQSASEATHKLESSFVNRFARFHNE